MPAPSSSAIPLTEGSANTAMHYQLAKDHGFTDITNFQIMDEDGSMTLPVEGGSVLTENYVGAAFADYDSYFLCILARPSPALIAVRHRQSE